jgi:UDP-glucose 4-epimerase
MRIVVTGGAGFIGSHIAEAAISHGHEVCVVDDLSSGRRENVPAGARFVELDIRRGDALDALIAEVKPEVISHQAAQTSVSVSTREPVRDADINVIGTIHLAQAAAKHGVGRLVFASTGGAIYGEVPDGTRAKEGDPTTPLSPYACSKLAAEHYLRYYAHEFGLQSSVLRYANVYGPRQDPHGEAGVVAIFAQRLKAGQPVQINAQREEGDAGCVRDYVYVGDVVRANLAAFDGRIPETVMNVCTGVATTTRMLADRLREELKAKAEVRYGMRRPGDLARSVLDPARCQGIVGSPTSLDEGLAQTAAWFAAQ